MTAHDILLELQMLGTEQNRKVFERHGVSENQFGVSFANLHKLAKRIGRDASLAEMLWSSGNHDARILACQVADPDALSEISLDRWAGDLNNYVITDAFSGLVAQSRLAEQKAMQWLDSDDEWISSTGWNLIAYLAMKSASLPDAFFSSLLERIQRDLHASPNRTRYSMNNALIAIGIRNSKLGEKAQSAARRIGKVTVDHGETSCKTPDAISYIQKTLEHRKVKA